MMYEAISSRVLRPWKGQVSPETKVSVRVRIRVGEKILHNT